MWHHTRRTKIGEEKNGYYNLIVPEKLFGFCVKNMDRAHRGDDNALIRLKSASVKCKTVLILNLFIYTISLLKIMT